MARSRRTSRPPPPAADLVRAWLGLEGRTQGWLAGALGMGESAIWAWLAGNNRPSLENAVVLERLTEGAVPASSWADPSEVEARVSAALSHG
jgi:hypothetical protein